MHAAPVAHSYEYRSSVGRHPCASLGLWSMHLFEILLTDLLSFLALSYPIIPLDID